MPTHNYYEGINHVVHLDSDESTGCEHCGFRIEPRHLAESINHYINNHGYKLLHVGQETTNDSKGNPFQLTVALLGR